MRRTVLQLAFSGLLTVIAAMTAVVATPHTVYAQDNEWPKAKPIKLLTGVRVGHAPDVGLRRLAEQLSQELGQTIYVENKPSAGGMLVMRTLKQAAPDGYTLNGTFWNYLTLAPSMFKNVDYDTLADFDMIGLWSEGHNVIVANPASGIDSIAALRAAAAKAPQLMQYGSPGIGAPGHLLMEFALDKAAIKLEHVPMGDKLVTSLMSGQINIAITGIHDVAQLINDGKLLAIGVTSRERLHALPKVKTLVEQGIESADQPIWAGLIGPKGMPPEVVAKLQAALRKVASKPEFIEYNRSVGRNLTVSTPDEMRSRVQREMPVWAATIKRLGLEQK